MSFSPLPILTNYPIYIIIVNKTYIDMNYIIRDLEGIMQILYNKGENTLEVRRKARYIKTDQGTLLMSPKNDFVFKSIFGDEKNKDILSAFLSAVMGIKKVELEDLQLVNLELQREFLEDKLGILDVRVKLKDGTDIDIEIQLSYTKYMAERSLYYWSKMYTSNIKKGDIYSKLGKVVTINKYGRLRWHIFSNLATVRMLNRL
jgi:hypothetical protein